MEIVILCIPIVLFLVILVTCVRFISKTLKNLRNYPEGVFREIDEYRNHWGETKEHYTDMVRIISFYYCDEGKIDRAVGNNLYLLYERLDYLKQLLNVKNNLLNCFVSVALSLVVSVFIALISEKGSFVLTNIILMLCFVCFIVAIIVFPYSKMVKSSYESVFLYEIKLLEKKIEEAQEQVQNDEINEEIFASHHAILKVLIEKIRKARGKQVKELKADLRLVESLNLYVPQISEYTKHYFTIKGTELKGLLLFKKNNELANEQYQNLYEVLRRLDLVDEIACVSNRENETK